MKNFLSVLFAGIWITASEFIRNEFLFKSDWTEHFKSLGLEFQTLPVNGILWMAWSFGLAYVIFELLKYFSFKQTFFIAWLSAFVMMWISLYNLQVLPIRLLAVAIPLSIAEIMIAEFIIKRTRGIKNHTTLSSNTK